MKKRIIAILTVIILLPLLVFSTSAIAFVETDVPDYSIGFIPLLDHNITFYDSINEVTFYSPILLEDGATYVDADVSGSSDDISGVQYYGINPLTYDFSNARYSTVDFNPFMVDIDYDPFSIRADKFITWDNQSDFVSFPFLETIGANYSWGGNFTADVEINIEIDVPWLSLDDYGYKAFEVEYRRYRMRVNLDNVSNLGVLPQESQIIVWDNLGNIITLDDFLSHTLLYNEVSRFNYRLFNQSQLWYDIQRVGINIYTEDGYFEVFNDNSAYISPNEMNDLTDLTFTTLYSNLELTPIAYGIRNASYLADFYNKDLLKFAWEHRDTGGGPTESAISRIISIFLGAVASFFSIDFFGFGFTIGNILGVFVLGIVTVIFLRLFAGG